MKKSKLPFLGHEKNFTSLLNLHQSGRLPHALLFLGPEGIGKQMVARHLAGSILKSEEMEQAHPDLIWIEPEGDRIKIDVIREIKKTLAYSPLMGDLRVVVLQDAHSMNLAAANALLKSLEEPPANTFFILITHALGWLPRTIVSRSQKIRFSPLPKDTVKQILQGLEVDVSEEFLDMAEGSPLQALRLMEVEDRLPALRSLFPAKGSLNFSDAYDLSERVSQEGQAAPFLQALLASTHRVLTGPRKHHNYDFDLLNFTDRILDIRSRLRQNINLKIQLTRLLLYFQEPRESRL